MSDEIVKFTENKIESSKTNTIENMRSAYELAKVMCQADIIPQNYKGRVSDCMIAIDMAERMGISPLMVMQSLYVVKGNPSWSGQACMSFIQSHPDFTDVKPVYVGEPSTAERGCYISARRKSTNAEIKGVCVTMKMANAEGWTSNSKWRNMPDLMLAYRAASFFARVYCPAILMGALVDGESDIPDTENTRKVEDVL